MIVKKIGRKAANGSYQAELRYTSILGRYITRANVDDVRALERESDDPYIAALARYVVEKGQAEQVRDKGSFNLAGDDFEHWQIELNALRFRSGQTVNITDHWILSWSEADDPADEDICEASRIFLKCLGLQNCPAVYGVHQDTDNVHVHLMIMRLDCVTANRVEAGQGWDIDASHRAKAVIEDRFPNWHREERSQYRVIDGRLVHTDKGTDIGPADDASKWKRVRAREHKDLKPGIAPQIDEHSKTYEIQTGWKSHVRVALEEAVPELLSATSWLEAHAKLSNLGIALEKTRKGGVLRLGDRTVKLSVDRRTSYANLVKLYGGDFQPSDKPVAAYQQREIYPTGSREAEYYLSKRGHDERLNMAASQLHFIEKQHGVASAVSQMSREAFIAEFAFPSLQAWLNGGRAGDPSQMILASLPTSAIFCPDFERSEPSAVQISGLVAISRRNSVVYRRLSDLAGPPVISDTGSILLIHDDHDPQVVRAALLIALQKWPNDQLEASGDTRFMAIAMSIAAELKIDLVASTPVKVISEDISRKEAHELPAVPGGSPVENRPTIPEQLPVSLPQGANEKLDANSQNIQSDVGAAVPQTPGPVPSESVNISPAQVLLNAWLQASDRKEKRATMTELALQIDNMPEALELARVRGHAREIMEMANERRQYLRRVHLSLNRGPAL